METEINDDNLKNEVLDSSIPVLVDVYSDSCMPCKMLSKILSEISSEYNGKIKICKANMIENFTLISDFDISSVPTVLLFKNGEVIDKKVGLRKKEALIEDIEKVIA